MVSTLILALLAGQLPKKPVTLLGGFDLKSQPAKVDLTKGKATTLFFVATDCPIANRYAPEIHRIELEYGKKGVQFRRIYILEKDQVKEVGKHGKEYHLEMPAILDPKRKLVAQTGVKVTPEVVVISSKGLIVYRGRIDDRNVEHGAVKQGYRRDLRVALDEFLAGKTVSVSTTAAIGCYL